MFCFSLPPDAFTKQRNRSTSETARQTAREEGYAPLLGWCKRVIDEVIQKRMGHPDLEFAWEELREVDPAVQGKIEVDYAHSGIKTINEARDGLGLEPIKGGDKPIVVAGATVVLLQDVEALSEQTVHPPAPMFGGPMGAGAPGQRPGGPPNAAGNARPGNGRGNAGSQSTGKPAGARNGSAAAKISGEAFGASESGSRAQRYENDSRGTALEREARQLLRRSRAARVETDIRAFGA
jgi:hypothetical protein